MTPSSPLPRVACALAALFFAAATVPTPLAVPTPAVHEAAAFASSTTATSTDPDYSNFHQAYNLPYTRKPNFDRLVSLHVRISIDGGPPTSFQVDTGSCGLIVEADEVPRIDPNATPGSITYSSSGVELRGVWTTATLTFPDAKDANGHVPTATIPILAANERLVHPGAVNGDRRASSSTAPTSRPRTHMLGIGFGRGAETRPDRNAFLNLAEMRAGTMRRGYTITREGITLGLTAADLSASDRNTSAARYVFQPLAPRTLAPEAAAFDPHLKDWQTAPGSVTVGNVDQPNTSILLDTGLTNMMIGNPKTTETTDVPDGTDITVHLLSGRLQYTFKTSDPNDPAAPRRVTWTKPRNGTPTLNTGLRALSLFDYLYDADGGFLALRPTTNHR